MEVLKQTSPHGGRARAKTLAVKNRTVFKGENCFHQIVLAKSRRENPSLKQKKGAAFCAAPNRREFCHLLNHPVRDEGFRPPCA